MFPSIGSQILIEPGSLEDFHVMEVKNVSRDGVSVTCFEGRASVECRVGCRWVQDKFLRFLRLLLYKAPMHPLFQKADRLSHEVMALRLRFTDLKDQV